MRSGSYVPSGGLARLFGPAPPAARLFAQTLFGDRSPITAEHFTPEELGRLRAIGEAALAKGQKSFGYGDYGERNPWAEGTRGAINALTDPNQSLAFTLGMANVGRDPSGNLVIRDRYHFAA